MAKPTYMANTGCIESAIPKEAINDESYKPKVATIDEYGFQ